MKRKKYINHARNMINIENKEKVRGKCLNLGSGYTYIKGYVNIDHNPDVKPDIVHNLNKYPYPFKDKEFDYIYASHILEHIDDIFRCLKELGRIIKPGGIIHIRVPHFSSSPAYTDLTHKRFFGAYTFYQIIEGEYNLDFSEFEIVYLRINFLSKVYRRTNKLFNWFINMNWLFYEKFLCWMLPSTEVEIKLRLRR